ncbi:alpha-N-acetylgalactosaminidase [Galendromus occidentalis]|uniref:Alpha-galactosidase n=1 Tax=Galendromus occidentalis TaxID=34638 RepID=A0AAJ7WJA5_9ACAR|nr:alpha-N-acetylgalactosaminidase [Galendromus occidentalis]
MRSWHLSASVPALMLAVFGPVQEGSAWRNGLAKTPPMGWLSWERFLCEVDCKKYPDSCISEKLYTQMADVMTEEGYRDAGYEYVNIDDCWMSSQRDFDGTLQANYSRFPHGIKWLADYMHARGLKMGIYQDCGTKTCGGYPGSEGFFKKDANTYAAWGVDMLKLDGCYADPNKMDEIYPQMTQALHDSGRSMVYSCSWPAYQFDKRKPDYNSISKHCNLWRNFDDIADSWQSVTKIMDYYAKVQDDLIPYSGPGAWSDPDMLIIGDFGLSIDQAKTQMAIWSILAAPLFMSADLRKMDPKFKDILLNRDVIAVDQDEYGRMGRRIFNDKSIQIWIRPVGPRASDGSMSAALAIHNRNDMGGARLVNISLSSIGLNFERGYNFTDLYDKTIVNKTMTPDDYLAVRVNPSGVVLLKATVNEAAQSTPAPKNVRNRSRKGDRHSNSGSQGYQMSQTEGGPEIHTEDPPSRETLSESGGHPSGRETE